MLKGKYQILKQIFKEKDISFLLLILSTFLLPLSINLSTFTFILSLATGLLQVLFTKRKLFKTRALKHSSIIGLIFFAYIIINSLIQAGFSLTANMFEDHISHWSLLFLTPILLRSKQKNSILIQTFILGVIVTVIYVLIHTAFKEIKFDRNAFQDIVDIHHTYLSLYLLLIINYFIIKLVIKFKTLNYLKIIIYVAIILLSFSTIFILNSKVSVIIFTILVIIHFFPEISSKNAPKYLLILLLLIATFFIFNKKVSVSYKSALDFRIEIWDASMKTIEESPFFGNLKSPEKDLLNFKHYISGKYYYLDSDLNSHNQYLSILLKYGIVGIILFSMLAINIFRKTTAKSNKDTLREFFGFAVIVFLSFYIENILDRHHGIVFFAIFYNYYLVAIENEKT